jgi:hypothetical protein
MDQAPFTIGASASCIDGSCGQLIRVIVNPVGRVLSHLVIGPRHQHGHHIDRLVPADVAVATPQGIRLTCTKAEFDQFEVAEEKHFVAECEHPGYDPGQVWSVPVYGMGDLWAEEQQRGSAGSPGPRRRTVTYDSVPLGEVQVRRGAHVHATDGLIGLVKGLAVEPDGRRVTHVLLQEGHPWGRKEVAIPIGAVTGFEAGIQVSLSKRQIEALPPVAIDGAGG